MRLAAISWRERTTKILTVVLNSQFVLIVAVSRHQPIRTFDGVTPKVGSKTFVAPSAQIIGKVEVGKSSSVGFGSTVRGDVNEIKIGESATIGDLVTIHVTRENLRGPGFATYIGNGVVVGTVEWSFLL